MTKLSKIIGSSILGLALLSSSASALTKKCPSVEKGQKAYQKELSVKCKMDSFDFAGYHTQEQWFKINLNGNFVAEVEDICEVPVSLTKKQSENIFKYVHTFAADSGLVNPEQG